MAGASWYKQSNGKGLKSKSNNTKFTILTVKVHNVGQPDKNDIVTTSSLFTFSQMKIKIIQYLYNLWPLVVIKPMEIYKQYNQFKTL